MSSPPPSPPPGIVSANIKLFNDRATNSNNNKDSNSINNTIKNTKPPPIPLPNNKPDIPIKHSLSSHTTPTHSHHTLHHHPIENIRRHVTGDSIIIDYHHQQLQHQKVFPHATGNGLLQTSHNNNNDNTIFSSSTSFLAPPPPPPRPAASLINSIDAKYNANNISTTNNDNNNNNNNNNNKINTTTYNNNINKFNKFKAIHNNTTNTYNNNISNNNTAHNNKKESDTKSNGLSSHVNTNVLKGVFGKVVGSVNDLLIQPLSSSSQPSVSASNSKSKISSPYNLVHVTHVGFNAQTGEFTGLPREWLILLQESGITKTEQRKNPQAVLDILEFYKETREQSQDTVWEKFGNAHSTRASSIENNNKESKISHTNVTPPPLPQRGRPKLVIVPSSSSSSDDTSQSSQQQQQQQLPPPSIPARPPGFTSNTPVTTTTTTIASPPIIPTRPLLYSKSSTSIKGDGEKDINKSDTQQITKSQENNSNDNRKSIIPSTSTSLTNKNNNSINKAKPPPKPPVSSKPTHLKSLKPSSLSQQPQSLPKPMSPSNSTNKIQPSIGNTNNNKHTNSSIISNEGPIAPPRTKLIAKKNKVHNNEDPDGDDEVYISPVAAPLDPAADIGSETRAKRREQRRQKEAEKDAQIIAELKAICTDADPTKLYRNMLKIGQGASGGVCTAQSVDTNMSVAIKQMNLAQQPKKELIINEILIMREARNKNIVNFIDSFLVHGELWVVMEYMEGGSLTDVVTTNMMTETQIATVCRETLQGIAHLHSLGIIHRDIKSDNVLLGLNGHVKISKAHTYIYMYI
ncbi:unnamed protein product [Cunninghamella blakesleeana]